MKIYFFGSTIDQVDVLYKKGFDGSLFLFNNSGAGDHFTKISNHLNVDKNFKYMVAIRPYVISPQYLTMIGHSFNTTIAPNKLEINLISGHIKEDEYETGGIVGETNDFSSNIERSNYLIKFLDSLSNMSNSMKKPEVYVSCTNDFTLNAAKKYGHKAIVPYTFYEKKEFEMDNKNTMIVIGPIFKNDSGVEVDLTKYPDDTRIFTSEEFANFLNKLKDKGVYGVLIYGVNEEDQNKVISFVEGFRVRATSRDTNTPMLDTSTTC